MQPISIRSSLIKANELNGEINDIEYVIEQRKVDASYSKVQSHEKAIESLIVKRIEKGRAYPMKTLMTDIEELELKNHKDELVTFGKTTLEKYIKLHKEDGKITE